MNEQIENLYKQAVSESSQKLHEWNSAWVPGTPNINYEIVLYKKFAELLIKECIGVPYAMWDKAELNADIAVKIEHRIKDHFGVE